MQLTNNKLSNFILYSNKNVEKLCRSLINESANAVLLEMFDDRMLLADHISGGIYLADYNFDGKTLALENFENVEVSKDTSELMEAIDNYFEDGYDTAAIVEAYENMSETSNSDLTESITEALAGKNINDTVNYSELIGINEECSELNEMSFFNNYKEHLLESPSSSIKFIDWVNPVRVSLINEDENRILSFSSREKAKSLSKKADFRKEFGSALKSLYEGYDSEIIDLLSENYSILSLDDASMKELIGMSVVGNKELMENRKELTDMLNETISNDEVLSGYKEVLSEAADDAESEGADEEDKKLETSDKDIDALKTALDKALETVTDEKLVKKIEDLKDALDESKSEGTTDVETVKECVELLSF